MSGRQRLCNGCKRNPDIICGPALKIDAAPDASTSFYFLDNPKIKQAEPFVVFLSRVSVTPFTATPSDIFDLPNSVFQIMLSSLTQWQETESDEPS